MLRRKYPIFLSNLLNYYDTNIINLVYQIEKLIIDNRCPYCNKIKIYPSYKTYSNKVCHKKAIEITNLEKYGNKIASKLKIIKNKIIETNKLKYINIYNSIFNYYNIKNKLENIIL